MLAHAWKMPRTAFSATHSIASFFFAFLPARPLRAVSSFLSTMRCFVSQRCSQTMSNT